MNEAAEDELEPMADSRFQGDTLKKKNVFTDSENAWSFECSGKNILLVVLSIVVVFLLGMVVGESETAATKNVNDNHNPTNNGNNQPQSFPTPSNTQGGFFPSAQPVEPAAPSSAKLTEDRAKAAYNEAQKLIHMLEGYYGPSRTMLNDAWAVNPMTKAFEKGNAYLLDSITRALVDDKQDSFIIGVIGSSVAAGHDNCNYDSYEKQLERLFSSVWEAAGMKLVVQNAGEGGGCGDSHENQVFCIKQNVSPWSDIVHYSWTYFEGRGGQAQHEQLVRWTQMMDRQAPVHIFNAGGSESGCQNDNKNQKLFATYSQYGHNALCLEAGLYSGGQYKGKVWGKVGDGYHNTTRYGETEDDQQRKDSLGVVFRNWHPGPLGFQFIADSFAYNYAKHVLNAIRRVQEEWKAGRDPRDSWKSARTPRLHTDLPNPVACDPLYCKVPNPPECLNIEEPTYGWYGASIADGNDSLNPYKGQKNGWKLWRDEHGSDGLIPRYEKIKYDVPNSPISCTHLDHCGAITAHSPDNGWLSLKLPKMDVGLVVVCGCCGKDVAKKYFIENPNIEFEFDGKLLKPETFDIFPNRKCARVFKSFPPDMKDSTGHAYLGIRIKPNASNPIEVRISHVITL